MRVAVFCDFDGTVSLGDTTDTLLSRLADPSWVEVEERWVRGEIGSRECMLRQVELMHGGWQAIERELASVQLEPTFAPFAAWCRENGIPLYIVSDGLDRVIHFLLEREGIEVEAVWANCLKERAESLTLDYSAVPLFGACQSGICKCGVIDRVRGDAFSVIIGDGLSDRCWSPHADLVFAKDKLLTYCREQLIDHLPFRDFRSVLAKVEALSQEEAEVPPRRRIEAGQGLRR